MSQAAIALRAIAVFAGITVPFLVFGRAVLAVTASLALLAVLLAPLKKEYWRAVVAQARSPVGVLLAVTLLAWLPSCLVSDYPFRSVEAWARVIVFTGGACAVWAALSRDAETLDLALKALVTTACVAVAISLVALITTPELIAFVHASGWRRVQADLALRAFASATMLLVPVVLWAGARLGGRWLPLAVAVAVGLLGVIWGTYSRSAIAGLLVMMVVCGTVFAWSRRRLATAVAVVLVSTVVLGSVLFWLYETRPPVNPTYGGHWLFPTWLIDYQRQTIWQYTLGLAKERPWLGYGINTINFQAPPDLLVPGTRLDIIPSHPHNWAIEVLSETGIVGLVPLVILVVYWFGRLVRAYARGGDSGVLTALAVSAGYWSSGLFNFSFWSAWWQVSYLVLTALCLAGRKEPRAPPMAP